MTARSGLHLPSICAVALLGALAQLGCSSAIALQGRTAATRPITLDVGIVASEFDVPPLEIVPLLEEEEARKKKSGAGRFGIRIGGIATTVDEPATWEPGGLAGVYYRGSRLFTRWLAYEVEFDVAAANGNTGYNADVSAALSFLRFDTLLGSWKDQSAKPVLYLAAGVAAARAKTRWELTDDEVTHRAGAIDLGLGLGGADGSWDARVLYSRYLKSENARGAFTSSVGFSF